MKKNAIVKNFKNSSIPGTYVMQEKSNFLVSKMMDIEDTVRISYNITPNDIGLNNIDTLNKLNYDDLKKRCISLSVDKSQTTQDTNNLTKWLFTLDSKTLLREYLYNEIYTINPNSAFKQINSDNVPTKNISDSCYNYIDLNILNRYKLSQIYLWVNYYDLKINKVPGTGTSNNNPAIQLLSKTPIYSIYAIPATSNIRSNDVDNKKETISMKGYDNGIYEISYKQTKSSQNYTFIYYYDVIFEKI